MKAWLEHFFGIGTEPEFANFTLAHFIPIILAAGVIWTIYRFRGGLRDWKHESKIRYTIAFLLILSDMSYYWRLIGMPSLGGNPVDNLPITVCGWAAIFCSYMLVGKNQTLFDISYFWLFSGSIFALVTPAVIAYTGPTRFRYYQFWFEHTLGYVAIFYMIFVYGMRPTIRSAVKSYAALMVLGVIALVANRMIGPGANYLFLAKPEDTPSILDILPPNFLLRLAVIFTVVTLMFGVSYLPWYLKDRRAAKSK